MIYCNPSPTARIDQGDILDDCPFAIAKDYDPSMPSDVDWGFSSGRIIVLTQTCDLANEKARDAIVASVFEVEEILRHGLLKAADIRGPVRGGRVFGWYFLPKSRELNLSEMIVDLRQLHTVRVDLLTDLCRLGQRRARLTDLYRAHLGKHFADTYSRIGLPEPYETDA